MTSQAEHTPEITVISDPSLAVVYSTQDYRFADGNPLQAARCVLCREPFGERTVTLIGVAALADTACECGEVVSDVYLIHADHLPVDDPALRDALIRALQCHHHRQ